MSYLSWIILFILGLILYKTVGKTLYIYYIYKKKYGKDLIVLFFPVIGWYYFVEESFKKYGDSLYFYKKLIRDNPNARAILALSGVENFLTILDNNWVKKCLQNQQHFYKGDGPFGYNLVFGEGLLFKNKQEWKVQRQFLQGNFHFNALKERFDMFKKCNLQFCENVKANSDYVKLNFQEQAALVSSDIISHSFLGKSIKDVKVNGKPFGIELISYVKDSFTYRITNPYFMIKAGIFGSVKAATSFNTEKERALLARAHAINQTLYQIIEVREKELKTTNKSYKDINPENFLDLYLQEIWKQEQEIKEGLRKKEEGVLTRHEIANQYNTLIFAGTDTTSHLLVNILFEISRNPDVYQRLQKEIDQHIPSFENLKFDDLNNLNYLRNVIKETQRMYPAIFYLFGRVMDNDYVDEDLYISKDLQVQIKLISQRQNPTGLFSEMEKFNPDRYDCNEKEDPYDFIPFSAGSRNCIGQYLAQIEIKLGIVYVLKKFHLKKNEDYQLKLYQEFVYSPVDKELFYIKRK